MYSLGSNTFKVSFLFFRITVAVSLMFLSIMMSLISKSHAQSPRLAVLELQGDVGTLAQRQAWTDSIRKSALTLLRDHGVMVIDRDQFAQLVDPSRDLSDCVGLCAAAIAREVGAHWSLSGSLTQDGSKAVLTLKVHNSMGSLLGVEQSRSTLLEITQQQLAPLTEKLINSSLFTVDEDEGEDETDRVEEKKSAVVDTQSSDQKNDIKSWSLVNTELGQHCASPLVTIDEYQQCVQAGVCDQAATWGTCKGDLHSPIRCINLKQALTFSRWKKGWIPSVNEWRALMSQSRGGSRFFEWAVPEGYSVRKAAEWRHRFQVMDQKSLKTAATVTVVKLSPTGRFQSKRTPPAFQVSDLSFRVITANLDLCQ